MINYIQGNLLEDSAEALVNTVNEVGVMGKGIALMFKERFPRNTELYERACEAKEVHVGRMLVTKNPALWGTRWIINFPTKKHWRQPSKLEWIREGLKDLVQVLQENDIHSVALPPLGCGNGGLEWSQVKSEIEIALVDIPEINVRVYVPTNEYQNAPKREGLQELTPARALIAELVRQYSVLGLDCTYLEVQKLAWFLNRSIIRLGLSNPLNLEFKANKYGPYADRLRHLLNGLDGSYLHCEKRLADASPLDLIWFEDSKREQVNQYLKTEPAVSYLPALETTASVIDGFESPLGMELLATVDWLLRKDICGTSITAVRSALDKWPGGKASGLRKQKLFDNRLLHLAIDRLTSWYKSRPQHDEETE
jgi:O-acetyl-ADP-ribose deacetylase (regulator of RNase III)